MIHCCGLFRCIYRICLLILTNEQTENSDFGLLAFFISYNRLDESLCLRFLPKFFGTAMNFFMSDHREVVQAAANIMKVRYFLLCFWYFKVFWFILGFCVSLVKQK